MCSCVFTFALAEVQLQDGLEQRVGVEGEVKLGADLRLQGPFHPLVLRRCHPLDQGIRDLHACKQRRRCTARKDERKTHTQEMRASALNIYDQICLYALIPSLHTEQLLCSGICSISLASLHCV